MSSAVVRFAPAGKKTASIGDYLLLQRQQTEGQRSKPTALRKALEAGCVPR